MLFYAAFPKVLLPHSLPLSLSLPPSAHAYMFSRLVLCGQMSTIFEVKVVRQLVQGNFTRKLLPELNDIGQAWCSVLIHNIKRMPSLLGDVVV